MIDIRASSFSRLSDCQRAWAFKNLSAVGSEGRCNIIDIVRPDITEGIRFPKKGMPAHTGTSAHKGLETLLRQKLEGEKKDSGKALEAIRFAFNNPEEEIAYGDELDESGKYFSVEYGKKKQEEQLKKEALSKLEKMFPRIEEFADKITPIAVEQEVKGTIADFYVEGHYDIYEDHGYIIDFKTGQRKKAHNYQLVAYASLGVQSGLEVNGIAAAQALTPGVTTPAKPVEVTEYNLADSLAGLERMAEDTLTKIDIFRHTGNPNEFLANPSSYLCSKRYCGAWGTEFCTFGQ